MADFKTINPATDIDWNLASWAQKTAQVMAERVDAGTVVQTIMADGHVETSKTAGKDGGYKITNPNGEQYLIDPAKFESRYDSAGDNVYRPKYDPIRVVQTNENVSFNAPWGEKMFIKAGGVLVKGSGDNDIYGIQKEEFENTYGIITSVGAPRPASMPTNGLS
jgi:hypothetical protein